MFKALQSIVNGTYTYSIYSIISINEYRKFTFIFHSEFAMEMNIEIVPFNFLFYSN